MHHIEIESAHKLRNSAQPFRAHNTTCQSSPRSFRQKLTHPLSLSGSRTCVVVSRSAHMRNPLQPGEENSRRRERKGFAAGWYISRSGYTHIARDVVLGREGVPGAHSWVTHGGARVRDGGVRLSSCGSRRVLSMVRPRVLDVYFATRFTTITVN